MVFCSHFDTFSIKPILLTRYTYQFPFGITKSSKRNTKQKVNKMTFAETTQLVDKLNAIETWVTAITREKEKDEPCRKELDKLYKYLEQDRQAVYDIANK